MSEINNPTYRRTDPREYQIGTYRGKAAIYRGGDGVSLVMIRVRFDWTNTPNGPKVDAFVLDPLPADVDDLEADLYESALQALRVNFISDLKVIR